MIEFTGVGRTFGSPGGRKTRAVDDVTFSIDAGEVFGIAGPNGAGKSTMIAMLLGFLPPSEGTVRIDGQPPRAYVERNGVGYLSELIAINPRWGGRELLVRYALLAGVRASALEARVDGIIELLGLGEHAGKRVKELSKGTLQRFGLGQALLRDERVLVLDEPTHGLDPVWTQRFRDIVPTLRRPDRAILIASHNLDELERLADRVAIVDRGRLQRIVRTRGAGAAVATRYRITTHGGAAAVTAVFGDAVLIAPDEYEVGVSDLADLNRALAALLARGVLLTSVTPAYSSLEEHFRQAVGGGDAQVR